VNKLELRDGGGMLSISILEKFTLHDPFFFQGRAVKNKGVI
jgi:hypothetical protein